MSIKTLTSDLKPTPAKLFFAGLIALGWAVMISHPMQLMVHHPAGMAWVPADFGKALAMWGIMVLAMMVPTLLPLFKTKLGVTPGMSKTANFLSGYLLAWAGFCVAATVLQYSLRSWSLIDMHDSSASIWLSAFLLMGAGIFQLTSAKQVHLKACQLSLKRVRNDNLAQPSYVISGLAYGADCIKCCWPMMLTMFVFGLMNIYAMAGLTTLMIAEKTVRDTNVFAKVTGGLFIAAGLYIMLF